MLRNIINSLCNVVFLILLMNTNAFSDYSTNLVFNGYIQDSYSSGDIDVGMYSAPVVFDWNSDGKKDLLVGQRYNDGTTNHGYVTYFENQGTNASPSFGSGTYIQSCAPCSPLDVAAGG
jgi:hypothetical protein